MATEDIETEALSIFDDNYLSNLIDCELTGHVIDIIRMTFIQGFVLGKTPK